METPSKFGIRDARNRPYHPQSQGQIKIQSDLKIKNKNNFISLSLRYIHRLDEIVYQYKNSKHSSTGYK